MNAKVTKVELVNGSMLSVTLQAASTVFDHDIDLETAIGGILNSSTTRRGSVNEIRVNTWKDEIDVVAGDEITADGEIIKCGAVEKIENTELTSRTIKTALDGMNS